MKKGDYVVHENHGIGKFLGIEQLTVQDAKKDYLKIKYAGSDMLYVPVEQMDIVQKYVGSINCICTIFMCRSLKFQNEKFLMRRVST